MADDFLVHKHVGRTTPAKGARLSLAGPNVFWLTVCTDGRQGWLTQAVVKEILETIWSQEATAWLVGDYLLMPDHVHCFCAPRDPGVTIEQWLGFWKSLCSKSIRHPDWRWQAGGFHHRIRSGSEFTEKWNYMMENPLRKNLVGRIEDSWPWQGRVHDVRWG
jgi:putative transposase